MYVNNANSKYLCLHMLILALFDDGRGNPVQLFIFSVMTQDIWSSERWHRFRRFINTSGSWTHLGVLTPPGLCDFHILKRLPKLRKAKMAKCLEMKPVVTSGSFAFPTVNHRGNTILMALGAMGFTLWFWRILVKRRKAPSMSIPRIFGRKYPAKNRPKYRLRLWFFLLCLV